jgi:hypothetical protein
MTWAQLERGLARCSDSDDEWPPSLPKFKRYCKITPEELGLPTLEDAYRIARLQRPDWSQVHPVIYHARLMVGLDTIIEKPDSVAWPRFEKAYQALVGRVLAGERFEVPVSSVPQLEYQRPRQVTAPGDARVHLRVLRDKLTSLRSR